MSSPQDSRARRNARKRRARRNERWLEKRDQENAQAAKPRTAKKTT
ncbi:MAG TPA: hypothetical protein VHO25_03915 [Polyangiaceae bacterium]|jgi:hypothetical protein|nr:hypothetical protein [Polyangiaceae bacterium]